MQEYAQICMSEIGDTWTHPISVLDGEFDNYKWFQFMVQIDSKVVAVRVNATAIQMELVKQQPIGKAGSLRKFLRNLLHL